MPEIPPEIAQKINLGQLEDLEEELIKMEKIEQRLLGDKNTTQKTVDKFARNSALYTTQKKLKQLIEESELILQTIAATGRARGKVLSRKAMDRYLEASERSQKSQRVIDAIDRANTARAQRRMQTYVTELSKETGILKSDIDIFLKRGRAAGLPKKTVLKNLVKAGADRTGPVQGYAKKLKSLETQILRREAQATEFDEYRKLAKPNEKWQWVTISGKPCPDCSFRAGKILSLPEWQDIGTPGSGFTVCGGHCKCKLVPMSVSEELFPNVKEFVMDFDRGVLTTAGQFRKLKAKKAH